jgi:uncharacterized cupredoxin-like copper-binding protein
MRSGHDGGIVEFTLDAGDYQLFCNIPGHLESGQITDFKVTDG